MLPPKMPKNVNSTELNSKDKACLGQGKHPLVTNFLSFPLTSANYLLTRDKQLTRDFRPLITTPQVIAHNSSFIGRVEELGAIGGS